MNALLRLLAVGRVAASVRAQAGLAGLRVAFGAVAAVLAMAGAAFLVAAGYQWLRWHVSAPVASAMVGGGLLLLALVVALAGHLAVRRKQRRAPAPALDPASMGLAALGPIAGAVSHVPPAVLAAAVAGFVYGLRGKSK